MPRKTAANSAEAKIGAMLNASTPLPEKPAHIRLRDCDEPFWADIMRSRAREEWMPNDLTVAAQLARCQSDIETESQLLDDEGSVVTNARGTQVMNPRHSVLQQLAQREMALMRCITLSGTVARGDKRGLGGARQLQAQAEKARSEVIEEDDLLAS